MVRQITRPKSVKGVKGADDSDDELAGVVARAVPAAASATVKHEE